MGTVETIFFADRLERPCDFVTNRLIVTTDRVRIEHIGKEDPMKRLLVAACAFAALLVPAFAYASRKTGLNEFMEFEDLTMERNTMDHTCTLLSEKARCVPVSQAITCYVGGFSLDTAQLTVSSTPVKGNPKPTDFSEGVVRATEQLTVQSTIAGEINQSPNNPSSDRREFTTSTIGTDEGIQLKARLA
ncbi:MAG: hypothetical protein E6G51_09715 [Actinobacteria bacterium]|nr:MAG: hypothetical protein E6G51_09715 [Actinomycetota bacterium]